MKSSLMLTWANLRKNKGQAASVLIFVLLASMFLNVGLVLLINFGSFFDARAEDLHSPDLTILQNNNITTEEQLSWLKRNPDVAELESQSVIAAYGDYYVNGSKSSGVLILADVNTKQSMNPPSLIGESLPLGENHIYVPYLMKAASGYELGDHYKLTLAGRDLEFIIAGFTEEISFGSAMVTTYRFYISDESYKVLSEELTDCRSTLYSIRTADNVSGVQVNLDYFNQFFYSEGVDDSSSAFIYSFDYENVKQSRTLIPLVMAVIVIAFAIIVLGISLIVMRFSIGNNIEQSMINIGALKAIGYRNRQIIAAIILQFSSTAAMGGILGVSASQLVLVPLSKILEVQSALIWNPTFDIRLAIASVAFVLMAVLLTSFLCAKRIRRLYPLIALRGGVETHSFRKNRFPLDRTYGGLTFIMGMKQITQNAKQSIMIVLIIAVMTFATVISMSLYFNVGVETDAFFSIIAGEKPDAALLTNREDTDAILGRLQERDEVRKAFGYQNITLMADDIKTDSVIIKDFSQLEGNLLYAGRYPKYENEVAIGGRLAEMLGKEIGDTVRVRQSSGSGEFIITGIVQMITGNGLNIAMPHEALLTIQEDYQFDQIYIYTNDDIDVKLFLDSVKLQEGDSIISTIDVRELADAQLGQYGSIFSVVAAVILGITILIVSLTLFMVIKTTIIRKKRDFGIQKALGFTTLQLMNQIALHYTPIILGGVVLGGLGGYIGLNPLFATLMKGMGILKTDLPTPLGWTLVTCLALTVLAYLVSLLIASRIQKVSPYELVSE